MMDYGVGGMFGAGGLISTFGFLSWFVWLLVGVLLAVFLWQKITKK